MTRISDRFKRYFIYLRFYLVIAIISLLSFPTLSKALSDSPSGYLYHVRSIEAADIGISHPVGLAFSTIANAFLIKNEGASQPEIDASTLVIVSLGGDRVGSAHPGIAISDALNVAFDERTDSLFMLDQATQEFIQIQTGPPNEELTWSQVIAHLDAEPFEFGNPKGITFDNVNGHLYILDAADPSIIRITPDPVLSLDGPAALRDGRVSQIPLDSLRGQALTGLAYNPNDRHLYTISQEEQALYELNETGQVVSVRDLSEVNLLNPQAMAFAPSGDSTDDPSVMNLYIADSGSVQPNDAVGGAIVELSLIPPTLIELPKAADEATLVRVINAYAWSPPAPDTAGVDYNPILGRLVVSDSEVEEMPPYFVGVNVYLSTTGGNLTGTCDTIDFSSEPTGVGVNPNNGHIFFTDDGRDEVYEINLGPDSQYCTGDDSLTLFSTLEFNSDDPEDVAYGGGYLFVSDGLGTQIYRLSPGVNGVFDGVPPQGDDTVFSFDTESLGLRDPEGIGYHHLRGTIFMVSRNDEVAVEATIDGTVIQVIDISFANILSPSDIGIGPGSQTPSELNIYISDRGIDNGQNPNENDGRIYEITIDTPPVSSATVTNSPTRTNTPGPSPTPTRTNTPGLTPTSTNTPLASSTPTNALPAGNLLINSSLELDANNDGLPDTWSTNNIFTRSNEVVHSGNSAGKFFATNSANANILQTVNNLTAGAIYDVTGWVNIPQPAGSSLSFQLKVEWRNGSTLIYRDTVEKYTGMTNGWDQAAGSLVAPVGTTNARMLLALSGLNGTIYVDDFGFGPHGVTPTVTFTPTSTNTPPASVTPTWTSTPSNTPTLTPTNTHTVSNTPTPIASTTNTPEPSFTPTNTTTATEIATATATDLPTSTSTSTSSPPVTDLIFADGFESGNFSAWSSARDTENDLSVSPTAALVGTNGMAALIDNTTAMYITDDTPVSEARYRARFYFDPNSLTMAEGDTHSIFGARNSTTELLRIDFRRQAGNYQIRAFIGNDTTAMATFWFTISDAPHTIEFDWSAATGVGANDGFLTLWIDGAIVANQTSLDNDTMRIEQARLGPYVGIDAGTSGTELFDAFASTRVNYIGP